jgi:hypothetical protein
MARPNQKNASLTSYSKGFTQLSQGLHTAIKLGDRINIKPQTRKTLEEAAKVAAGIAAFLVVAEYIRRMF